MSQTLSAAPERKFGAPLCALLVLSAAALFLQARVGAQQVLLLVLGAALGLTLYHVLQPVKPTAKPQAKLRPLHWQPPTSKAARS